MSDAKMDKVFAIARRKSGIAAFERNCGLTQYAGRMCKAFRVPGTKEAGRWNMLNIYCNKIANEIRNSK